MIMRNDIMKKSLFYGANLFDFLSLVFYIGLVFYLIASFISNNTTAYNVLIVLFIITEYLLSVFWANVFYFYDDKIIICYPTRIFKRKFYISYSQINHVRYINKDSKASSPTISLEYSQKGKRFFYLPSNSFAVHYYKKRQAILKFLKSKGIPIEIESKLKKDLIIME